jgi:peptide/nickel transport system substrate-binding protein
VTSEFPFHCVWFQTEDRTPRVVLEANPNYWNTKRGARLEKVVFLNDVSQKDAIEKVCAGEGEVDIVTNVAPEDVEKIENSEHAKIVAADALRNVFGVFNRAGDDNLLNDVRLRQAFNLALDRDRLVKEGLKGYGEPAGSLTPLWTYSFLTRPKPYDCDPKKAAKLRLEAGWEDSRELRLAVPNEFEKLGHLVAQNLRDGLQLTVDLKVLTSAEKLTDLRNLAERKGEFDWDVFLYGWSGQISDAPPLELHYQVLGKYGALRRGGETPAFDDLYRQFNKQTEQAKQAQFANDLDEFVREDASALFLCSRQAIYAVNREVSFTPYASTFELAECEVGKNHWSRREKD